jgi:hypothetical protein
MRLDKLGLMSGRDLLRSLQQVVSRLVTAGACCVLLTGSANAQDAKRPAERPVGEVPAAASESAKGKPGSAAGELPSEAKRLRETPQVNDSKRQAELARAMSRKDALLEFAGSQDEQLAKLLRRLEQQRPQQFREALLNLARDEERLNNLQARDRERYELELQQWKNNQRLQIVAARLALGGDEAGGRVQLEKLLQARQDVRRQILELEVRRAEERVTRAQEQLHRFEETKTADLKRQAEQLLARVKRGTDRSVAGASNEATGKKSAAKREIANPEPGEKSAAEKASRNQKDK